MSAAAGLLLLCGAAPAASLRYWIQPCTASMPVCRSSDAQLAQWAMEAWQAASDGQLKLERTADRGKAHIRLFWAAARHGVYGETRPIVVDGLRGAEVYVLPATGVADESDVLMRDVIVYLTCLHEAGHALGLGHTAAFSDIMYSFRYGGNIPEYFDRYRRQLREREDIHHHPGMSGDDRRRLQEVWSAPPK